MSTDTPQLLLSKRQRSHMLFVLSNPSPGHEAEFLNWYQHTLLEDIFSFETVVGAQHFARHEVDMTMGHYPPPDYAYLSLYELSVDGAEEAEAIIAHLNQRYAAEPSTKPPATWLYYPVSEKVGRATSTGNNLLTLAFANSTPGNDGEFREWYCTRHIRHALYIPILVSGQCFELTQFQQPGDTSPEYQIIAVYEQEGSPQEFIEYVNTIPPEVANKLQFPTLDATRFGECAYYPVTDKKQTQMERE